MPVTALQRHTASAARTVLRPSLSNRALSGLLLLQVLEVGHLLHHQSCRGVHGKAVPQRVPAARHCLMWADPAVVKDSLGVTVSIHLSLNSVLQDTSVSFLVGRAWLLPDCCLGNTTLISEAES